MTLIDRPIHLTNYSICKREPHSQPSVEVPVWITQSSLDGMQALIQFINGLEAAGKGQVPGGFDLIMFYRQLDSAIRNADNKARDIGVESNDDKPGYKA